MARKSPGPEYLTPEELKQLSGPKRQRAVMGMRYYTGKTETPIKHLLILYNDGLTEWTDYHMKSHPANWIILFHQEARKKGFLFDRGSAKGSSSQALEELSGVLTTPSSVLLLGGSTPVRRAKAS